jgi:hypothetical protein
MSLSVMSRPSRSLSSLAASVEVSASDNLSASMPVSCLLIFYDLLVSKSRITRMSNLLFSEKMLSPNIGIEHGL